MNTDDFEQRLQRQPIRRIPARWRGEILREGRPAAVPEIGNTDTASLPTLNWRTTLANLFWPHPKAWAGLAAVWVLIFCLDFSMRDTEPVVAAKASPLSREAIAELRQEHQMWAELIGVDPASDAEPPEFLPQPRSERVEILMT